MSTVDNTGGTSVIKATTEPAGATGPNDAVFAAAAEKAGIGAQPQGDANNANASAGGDRPSWLPENFKTPEDLVKSYNEARATLSRTQQDLAALRKGSDPNAAAADGGDGAGAEDAAREAVSNAGLDFDALSAEYTEYGALSDNAYEALENAGIPREYVDAFIEGQQARAAAYRSEVLQGIGEEGFAKMAGWMRSNLQPAEIESFIQVVDSGDVHQARLAMKGMQARFVEANGQSSLLDGGDTGAGAGSSGGFNSRDEMVQAMSDPRYARDEHYRRQVEQRVMASTFF